MIINNLTETQTPPTWWRYVILCEENKFYVGITLYPLKRWKEHERGVGSKFTKCFKPLLPVEIINLHTTNINVAKRIEDDITYEMILELGIENVCGGGFCNEHSYNPKWHIPPLFQRHWAMKKAIDENGKFNEIAYKNACLLCPHPNDTEYEVYSLPLKKNITYEQFKIMERKINPFSDVSMNESLNLSSDEYINQRDEDYENIMDDGL